MRTIELILSLKMKDATDDLVCDDGEPSDTSVTGGLRKSHVTRLSQG